MGVYTLQEDATWLINWYGCDEIEGLYESLIKQDKASLEEELNMRLRFESHIRTQIVPSSIYICKGDTSERVVLVIKDNSYEGFSAFDVGSIEFVSFPSLACESCEHNDSKENKLIISWKNPLCYQIYLMTVLKS